MMWKCKPSKPFSLQVTFGQSFIVATQKQMGQDGHVLFHFSLPFPLGRKQKYYLFKREGSYSISNLSLHSMVQQMQASLSHMNLRGTYPEALGTWFQGGWTQKDRVLSPPLNTTRVLRPTLSLAIDDTRSSWIHCWSVAVATRIHGRVRTCHLDIVWGITRWATVCGSPGKVLAWLNMDTWERMVFSKTSWYSCSKIH